MCENLGINVISYITVNILFRNFNAGTFDTADVPHSSLSIDVDCEQFKQNHGSREKCFNANDFVTALC